MELAARDCGLLLALALLAAAFTLHMIRICRASPVILEPSAGQVGCCLSFAFVWLLWVTLRVLPVGSAKQGLPYANSPKVLRGGAASSGYPLLHALQSRSLAYVDAAAEFGAIMALFWVCDRTAFFERSGKHYSRDFFWFLWAALMMVGLASVRRCEQRAPSVGSGGEATGPLSQALASRYAKPLQRDQTEEWKGWMQVMFLLYHYFEAKELYNAIRIYIAAYVWMTGFGNFSYYYVRQDFGLPRFCQMMWRLNFLCFFCCLVLQNDYMLYYICMLHTAFTVIIYATLGINSSINQTPRGMWIKFTLVTLFVLAVWHVPGMFDVFWWPWRWLALYKDSMHEWRFRSTLDHLVWIVGMATAFNFPRLDAALARIESLPKRRQLVIKGCGLAASLIALRGYYTAVFSLDKYAYNALHPYTSWLPITIYLVLRNLSPTARQYYMHFFAWLGRITLETYIAQFHIWMTSTGPDYTWEANAAPKRLLRLLPPGYPLLNFVLVSLLYVGICSRIFACTAKLKELAVPTEREALLRNLKCAPPLLLAVYVLSQALRGVR